MVVLNCISIFFFFKQKTAYEMLRSLVGSEMCIRDSFPGWRALVAEKFRELLALPEFAAEQPAPKMLWACLLYTSDAADDLLCVDLGGCRII